MAGKKKKDKPLHRVRQGASISLRQWPIKDGAAENGRENRNWGASRAHSSEGSRKIHQGPGRESGASWRPFRGMPIKRLKHAIRSPRQNPKAALKGKTQNSQLFERPLMSLRLRKGIYQLVSFDIIEIQ
jgi:hypothetical protein